jgi:hypothetical protein
VVIFPDGVVASTGDRIAVAIFSSFGDKGKTNVPWAVSASFSWVLVLLQYGFLWFSDTERGGELVSPVDWSNIVEGDSGVGSEG